MSHKNTAAFPGPGVVLACGSQQGAYEGMSLRDYFAAKAMQGALSACAGEEFAKNLRNRCVEHNHCIFDALAMDAYALADAMLVARDK